MKRVVMKLTKTHSGWMGVVNVDGEEFAKVSGPDYLTVAAQTVNYVHSLSGEEQS